ncbi:hypothetical protein MTR_1g100190 [Medicago truncatula]|uniref:Uncharacterized protein n=1 Tax=Medicago truncatula TaxID=3880 RepID=G7IEN4_MEDTR|nr:hypothetical protein MTR_1g100190 [Medicago truncatula]
MAGKDMRVHYLLERVLRQFGYVQTVPRHPTDIGPLATADVAMAFMEFALHVLSQLEMGDLVPDNELLAHYRGYMRWFVRVSHPIVNPLRPFLTTQLMPILVPSLPTRRLLLSSNESDILLTHIKSSTTSEPEWTVQ